MTAPTAIAPAAIGLWASGSDLHRRLQRTLQATGASVTVGDDPAAFAQGVRLVVANADDDVSALLDRIRDVEVVLLTSSRDRGQLAEWLERESVRHVLGLSTEFTWPDLAVTLHKLLRADHFGAGKYLAWGAPITRGTLAGSADKDTVIEALGRFVDKLDCNPRIAELATSACEELLTNAVYDAPVDDSGTPRFKHYTRTQAVRLDAGQEVRYRFSSDGHRLAIAVEDVFGALDLVTLKRYLARGLRGGYDQIEDKPGGAGLGLHQVFDAAGQLVVNVRPGERTEIIALFDISGSNRDFAAQPKSVGLFT